MWSLVLKEGNTASEGHHILLNSITIVTRKSRRMDQLLREATDIVLCLRNVNMEESLSLNRLRSLSFTLCKKGSKKHSPRVEQSTF